MQRTVTYTRWIAGVATVVYSLGLPFAALAAAPTETARPLHLDLRPPTLNELAEFKAALMRPRRAALGGNPGDADDAGAQRISLPSLMGRQETLVQRFGREGLPIARLWENRGALVSLGLSPRGKPGLWLVQKIH